MTSKERLAASIFGAVIAIGLVIWLVSSVVGAFSSRSQSVNKLKVEIVAGQAKIRSAKEWMAKMSEWETRSLPADVNIATSYYQDWLTHELGLSDVKWTSASPQGHKPKWTGGPELLTFKVAGTASLEQLTRFLFGFYSINTMHKFEELQIKADPKDPALVSLEITIEALAFPTSKQTDINESPSPRLANSKLANYAKIADRNVFADDKAIIAETPPRKPNPLNPAEFATFTSFFNLDDKPMVWLHDQTNGQIHRLHEGDEFRIGEKVSAGYKGKVIHISQRAVEIETPDGKRVVVQLGVPLSRATAAPAGKL